jgi:hypothetical protein
MHFVLITSLEILLKKHRWQSALIEIIDLAKRLKQVNPLVIDYFLGQNADLQPIGKLMIALVILECEAQFLFDRKNDNRREILRRTPLYDNVAQAREMEMQFFKDDWYRFILHKLSMNFDKSTDIMKNQVQFVTFNYDVSLEYELDMGLRSISLFKPEDVELFLSDERILHVYGQVRKKASALPPINLDLLSRNRGRAFQYQQDRGAMAAALKPLLDTVYDASKNLRVISPLDKDMDMKVIDAAKKAIADAACVYVLGYGFDENNSKRLDLFDSLKLNGRSTSDYKAVLFTNYGDINRVNKKASELFMGNFQTFLPQFSSIIGNPRGDIYCEKSVRDVYEALALDFDALEDQLIGGSKI